MSRALALLTAALLLACRSESPADAPPPGPPPAPSPEATADPDDPWARTGLTFDQAAEAVTPEGCYASEQRFLACAHAVGRALAEVDPGWALVPLPHDHAPIPDGRVLRRQGRLAVVSRDPGAPGPPPRTEAALRAEIAAWRSLHGATQTDRLDWAGLLTWFREAHVTPRNEAAVTAAAINGFLATAKDPFHRIVPTQREDALRERAGTTHVGIGAFVQRRDREAILSGLVPDGPAERAGARVGDVLLAIDAQRVADLSTDEIVGRLRGEAGTQVALSLRRDGQPLELTVTRAQVATRYVQEATLFAGERRLGFLYVPTFFSTHICAQVREGLTRLAAEGAAAWVLDLRGNVGGLTEEALCVADLFLPADRIVARLHRDGHASHDYRTAREAATALPLVVLVNASTGSAAEILAGALQDEGRAHVVGERTYGKGTVQNPFPWGEGVDVTVYFTSGRFTLPSGRAVHLLGVAPDLPLSALIPADQAPGGATDEPARVEREYLEALLLPEEQASAAGAAPAPAPSGGADGLLACARAELARAADWYGVGVAGREPLGAAVRAGAAAATRLVGDPRAAP